MSRFRRIIQRDDSSIHTEDESSNTSINTTGDVEESSIHTEDESSNMSLNTTGDVEESSIHTEDESSNMSLNTTGDVEESSKRIIDSSDDEGDVEESSKRIIDSSDDEGDVEESSKRIIDSSDDEGDVEESSKRIIDSSDDEGDDDFEPENQMVQSPPSVLPKPLARSSTLPTKFSTQHIPEPKEILDNSSKSTEDSIVSDDSDVIEDSACEVLSPPRSSVSVSTRLLPVPKEMLNNSSKPTEDSIALDDSDVIEDSASGVLPQPRSSASVSTRLLPVPTEMFKKGQEDDECVIEDSGSDKWHKIQERSNADVIVIEETDDSASYNETGSLQSSSGLPTTSPATERSDNSASFNETDSLQSCSGLPTTSAATERSDDSTAKNKTGSFKSFTSAASSFSSTNSSVDSQSERRRLKQQIDQKALELRGFEHAYKNCDLRKLKDGGAALRKKMECCRLEVDALMTRYKSALDGNDDIQVVGIVKPSAVFSNKDQKTAHLGKIGLQTHRVETALTLDGLVSLHGSLETMPAADAEETDPAGLRVELMSHQRQALAWLLHREKQTPAGGILADDMGLGKTLTMIALIMKSAELFGRNLENEEPTWKSTSSVKKHPGKTLVVCPASLIGQWESQVKQHVRGNRLVTLLHHGNAREGRGRELCRPDIVITTYGVLAQDYKNKVGAFRVAWERIILDEAHQIRNHKTQAAISVCELEAKYRWCLTGTPFHNKQLDVYSLLKFLRCRPFDDLTVWKRWVDNKKAEGTERLNTIIKSILLRRTKEELKLQGKLRDLPAKELHEIRVELDEHEFGVYETVLKFSQKLVARYLSERAVAMDGALLAPRIQQLQSIVQKVGDIKTHEILVLLLRLRQICCLPGLISAMLEEDEAALADGFEKPDPVVESLFKQVRRLTISAPPPPPREEKASVDLDKVLVTSNPVFDMQRSSSKMKTVLGRIEEVVKTGDKVVIVSQWSSFLKHLAGHLKALPFKIATLDGSVPVKSRGALVDEFNDPNSKLRLLLLSLTAGGVGLNLIGANHLVIMEPHWNPQLEAQACDRIYRVGQKKPVHIYKVICKQTIEEQIEQLQKNKLEMADKVLTGQLKKELSKLSLQDLKSLFNL